MSTAPLSSVLRHLRRLVTADGPELSDRQMLDRFIVRREEGAFTGLVERYGSLVRGVCRRVTQDDHDAEDAFQATFLILAKKAGSIRRGQSLAGWLYRVAYRAALKARLRAVQQRARQEP